jgi:hypothetical protein
MDNFDRDLENLSLHKSKYLELRYKIYLETQKPPGSYDAIKIEKLGLKASKTFAAYAKTHQSLGRGYPHGNVMRIFTSHNLNPLTKEVHEFIKGKGHQPRRIYGFIFAVALLSSLFVVGAIFFGTPFFAVLPLTIAVSVLWAWWSTTETFDPL